MTKRERYLKASHNCEVDKLVWAPNFDYWYQVNKAEDTLPEEFIGMSRNDIVRAIDGCIWGRSQGINQLYDSSVSIKKYIDKSDSITEYITPIGTVSETYSITEGVHRSRAVTKHLIKSHDDIKILKYLIEATQYTENYAETQKALDEIKDDGIVINSKFCVPFIQFAKTDVGYSEAFYMWSDYREEVDDLVNTYFKSFLEGFRLLAKSPADVLASGDNMDGLMISPTIFKEYVLPYYQELKKITSENNKLLEAHWCGRTETLLEYLPQSGVDIVEAVVTKPMSTISLSQALEKLDGKVVLQGGIPAIIVCANCCDEKSFEKYIEENILPHTNTKGFILGMSDNVPPNADFNRVKKIASLISK